MLETSYSSSELSIEDYHGERDHESSSNLKNILITPVHYLDRLTEPEKETEALKVGSAIHAAMLEPDLFDQQYVVAPKFDRRTKDGKEGYQAFLDAHPGKKHVMAEDVEFISKLRSKIRKHKQAWKLLALPGEAETSIFWTDDETGIRLKCRPDRIIMLGKTPVYISVKTTANAEKEAFAYDIDKFDYHMAEAMYRDGIYQKYGRLPQVLWLVIEKKTWEVCVYSPTPQTLDIGYERYRQAVHRLKTCQDTGNFFGYQPDGELEEISLPQRAIRREATRLQLCA